MTAARQPESSNKRSTILGAIGSALPLVGALLGIAAIAGATGCHMEVLLIPFTLIVCGSVLAIVAGVVALRISRSKRGRVMPVVAIVTGVASLAWIATMIAHRP